MARAGNDQQRMLFSPATLLRGHLVLMDRASGSWWLQRNGHAIAGPYKGVRLPKFEHSLLTWGEWRRRHPTTTVVRGQ